MGQATLDLPDPLDVSADTGSAGTDDLLSQLAGEEIDRLLADSDSDSPPASTAAEPAARASSAAAPATPGKATKEKEDAQPSGKRAAAIDPAGPASGSPRRASRQAPSETVTESGGASPEIALPTDASVDGAAPGAVVAEDEPAAAPPDVDLAAGMDAIFSKLTPNERAQDASAATTTDSADRPISAEAQPSSPPRAGSAAQAAAEMAEADGLAAEAVADEAMNGSASAPAIAPDAAEAPAADPDFADLEAAAEKSELTAPIPHEEPSLHEAASEPDQPPSLLVRALELFNAPMSACPEPVREVVGKIALITLVNAVAVLAYVLIFRRR